MSAYLEVWKPEGLEFIRLERDPITVGRGPGNDVKLPNDNQVSRLHALLEPLAGDWCVRDVTSRNGTFVNGERVSGDRPLRPGDEILVGRTRMVFRAEPGGEPVEMTEGLAPPPTLTARERDVLLALFRPVTSSEIFTEPASTKQIAEALWISEAAVKQHLLHLYDKFGIFEEGERRRVRLANEALKRGAITLAEARAAAKKRG